MAPLLIQVHDNEFHHHTALNKKQTSMDSGYQSDDLTSFASSPTTSTCSRRSSFSSPTSISTKKQHRSSAPPQLKYLYPTLQSAYDRIQYLEEQLKQRESKDTAIKKVSSRIDTFLKNRQVGNLEPSFQLSHSSTDSSLVVGPAIVEKLNELKTLVENYNMILVKDKEPGIDKKLEIFFSTQTIEKWIDSATQHKSKRDSRNVDSTKHHRISQAIQRLSHQHTQTRKQLNQYIRSETHLKRNLNQLHTKYNQQRKETIELKQDKEEIEVLLDEIRNEMENMMEELNQVKLQRDRNLEKANRFENDIKLIKVEEEDADILALQSLLRESETQINQLESDFKEKLGASEQSNTELSLLVEVYKEKKHDDEMEQALRRAVGERDAELAKVKFELEKSQKYTEQMKSQRDRQMQIELKTLLEDAEQTLKMYHQKESDTHLLRITREMRELSGKIVDLETELEDLEYRHQQDIQKFNESQIQIESLQFSFKASESIYKESNDQLEKKVQTLEAEVLLLYSKNLELAQHLGELDL